MPKHRAVIVTVIVLALAALAPASALAKAGGTDRPVKGTAMGSVTATVPGLHIKVDVSGVETHIGKFTGHFEGTGEIVGGSTLGEGTFTVVAANGDQMTGTFTLIGSLPTGEVHSATVVLTITGGTGRFADASGTITTPIVLTPSCFLEPSCPGASGRDVGRAADGADQLLGRPGSRPERPRSRRAVGVARRPPRRRGWSSTMPE